MRRLPSRAVQAFALYRHKSSTRTGRKQISTTYYGRTRGALAQFAPLAHRLVFGPFHPATAESLLVSDGGGDGDGDASPSGDPARARPSRRCSFLVDATTIAVPAMSFKLAMGQSRTSKPPLGIRMV